MSNVLRLMVTTFVCLCVAGVAAQNNCTSPNMTSLLYILASEKSGTTVQASYKHGDWLFFRCKNNSQLVGCSLRICISGSWSGTTPVCIPKATPPPQVKCKRLRNLKHGKIRGRRGVNAVVKFSCSSGYNIMGPKKLTCLATGKWSGHVPRCLKDVSCPNLCTPRNGVRDGTKFKYGRRVKYSCNTGYKLVGSISRKCMSNGKWSGKRAKCVKIDPAVETFSGVDFVFVLDSSASVGKTNFRRGIELVKTIVKEYGVSTKPRGTRVAIVTFNAAAEIKFNLATNVINDTDQAMRELGNIQFQGGGTNTEAALSKVYHHVSPEARKGSHKVLFLITDGRSNTGTNPRHFAERLRERNYEIFAIGITKNADQNELKSIASQPYRSHIHLLADYTSLEKLRDMITGNGYDKWECGQAGDTRLRDNLTTPNRKLSKDDAWPWQAIIYVDAAFKCGGALVADNWVLTAASCFDKKMFTNLKGHTIRVVLGEHNRFDDAGTEQTYEVVKLIRPSKSGKNRSDDIAMVKLQYPIKPTSYVHAVCYNNESNSSLTWPTQYGVVTGWGSKKQTKSNSVTIPAFDEPQQTVIKFVSDRECREKSNIKRLKGNVFCGSSQDDCVDECLGDTGGPVVVKLIDDSWTLVGVMKVNEGCTDDSKYSLFTKVGHYSAWISETILKQ
ncbi:complement factor B-like [Paramuricea clavata]|uniref:C3/C5 convertase n=1 Tax=Paramuricea clavata TaxID=317549 RepID=A0A6S7H3R0_PARCT|nr:complement factor B-like [Paramuricea clavata]